MKKLAKVSTAICEATSDESSSPGARSTAAAARLAAEDATVAAIGSAAARGVYGLRAVAESIEDRRDNSTRFIVIGRDAPERSGSDLTAVVFTIRKDQPGGLHQLIEAKEDCAVSSRTEVLARISYQRFFRRYLALAGMTGTAETEAEEFQKVALALSARATPALPIPAERLSGSILRKRAASETARPDSL